MKISINKAGHNNKEKDQINFFSLRKIIIIILTLFFVFMIIGFAYIKMSTDVPVINTIKTKNGFVSFEYKENIQGINIDNFFPIKDEIGKKMLGAGEYFDFNIEGSINQGRINYKIVIDKNETSVVDDNYIKVYLTQIIDDQEKIIFQPILFSDLTKYSEKNERVIYEDNFTGNITKKYRLRMWIDENSIIYDNVANDVVDIMGKEFSIKLNVYANQE
ncbi:MAG: hypothetical protein GX861_02490 [Tenericutes bacterium]|jgi:hypothetical protein|nr:hypothetical protein [Mycoplasmatota bacterium]